MFLPQTKRDMLRIYQFIILDFSEGSDIYLRISICKTNYLDGYNGENLTLDSDICTDPEFSNTF